MTIAKCSTSKPAWPYRKETILTPSDNGQWSKKFRGRRYYFGPWRDPEGALRRWRQQWPRITTGLPIDADSVINTPSSVTTVQQMCTAYLEAKQLKVDMGELSPVTLRKYTIYATVVARALGRWTIVSTLKPIRIMSLLSVIKDHSVHYRSDFIIFTRSLFKWAVDMEIVPPIKLPRDFRPPSKRIKRAYKEQTRRKPIEAWQVRRLLAACSSPELAVQNSGINGRVLAAAIYLGINGGYGPADLAEIHVDHIDFDNALIKHLRPKTAMWRQVPLWPETVRALKRAMRPGEDRIFVGSKGLPLVHDHTHVLGNWFKTLLKVAGMKDTGMRFYDLRRTFATVAAVSADKDARKLMMGHSLGEVHDDYVLRFPRQRLDSVSQTVRWWFIHGRLRTADDSTAARWPAAC